MHLPARIFLIGFSASGKTTVGPLLASRLNYKLVDCDQEIERLQGISCQQIINQRGLEFFRECESGILTALCREGSEGTVAALGGGAITIPGMLEQLRSTGVLVWLRVSLKTVISRLPDLQNRPLLALKTPTEINRFLELRNTVYEEAADIILDVDERTPDEIALEIISLLNRRAESIRAETPL
jgi:shikimate kinase